MSYGAIKARIADEMKRGELTASATAVAVSVIDAIKHFEGRRFAFNEFIDTTSHSTSASVAYVTITSTLQIVALDSVRVTIGTRDYPLEPRTWDWIESIDSGQWAGYPENYCRYTEDLIRMYPIPNASYPVKLSGIKRLLEVSLSASASATNAWTGRAEQMIRCHAKGILFRDQLRAPENATRMFGEAERYYQVLRKEARKQASTGRVRPSTF